jgi:hypothetical protein
VLEISGDRFLVVSELSPAPSLLVCTMNTGWKRLQHESGKGRSEDAFCGAQVVRES